MIDEQLISYIWQQHLMPIGVITTNGKRVEIITTGTLNNDQGPDFLNSKLYIDNTLWIGNIEIHLKSSDWFRHNHQYDNNYSNVICHVVWIYDAEVYNAKGEIIPTIELSRQIPDYLISNFNYLLNSHLDIPCKNILADNPKYVVYSMLDTCYVLSLEEKVEKIKKELIDCNNNFDEMCYHLIMRNFGFKINNDAFEMTAKLLQFNILRRNSHSPNTVSALLFGQANLLNKQFQDEYPKYLKSEYEFNALKYNLRPQISVPWKMLRLHPANFPYIRIAQASAFICNNFSGMDSLLYLNSINEFYTLFINDIDKYWNNHVVFDKITNEHNRNIGKSSVDIILINTVIPLLYSYGKIKCIPGMCDKALNLIENISSEDNYITRMWKKLGINTLNAVHSQALIYLKRVYCDGHHCMYCKIGAKLIRGHMV